MGSISKQPGASDGCAAGKRVTVFHDGDCPLCQLEIRTMRRLNKSGAIDFVDINREDQALKDAGIEFDQAMNRFHVRDDLQGVQTGVRGFICVWRQLPYFRWLVPLVTHTPGLLSLLESLYGIFARYRLVLTGRKHAANGAVKHDDTEH